MSLNPGCCWTPSLIASPPLDFVPPVDKPGNSHSVFHSHGRPRESVIPLLQMRTPRLDAREGNKGLSSRPQYTQCLTGRCNTVLWRWLPKVELWKQALTFCIRLLDCHSPLSFFWHSGSDSCCLMSYVFFFPCVLIFLHLTVNMRCISNQTLRISFLFGEQ